MGKLQITTAEIKTCILRVCHVKKDISTLSHVKNPYLTCVSCALYTLVRVGYNTTELPAVLAIVNGRVVDRQGRITLLYTVSFVAVADSLVIAI